MTNSEIMEADTGQVRECLENVLHSDELNSSPRLQEFLTYIVEEKLSGRADKTKAKTIAADIYGRKNPTGSDSVAMVRVDAGRLRRQLEKYYTNPELSDEIKFEVPSGTYVPNFKPRAEPKMAPAELASSGSPKTGITLRHLAFIAASLIVAGTIGWFARQASIPLPIEPATRISADSADLRKEVERQVIFAKSPASLQARQFTEQARGMIFPPSDKVRLQNALDQFINATERDETYFGGHAGAAQVYGWMAMLWAPGKSAEYLGKARMMSRQAQSLDPSNAWVQTSLAWVAFASKDFDQAVQLANQAAILDPNDANNRDFQGLIALFNGDFEKAVKIVKPHLDQKHESGATIHRNIYAIASYFLGEYRVTIDQVEEITSTGGSTGRLLTALLIAAHQAVGDTRNAKRIFQSQKLSWPKALKFESQMLRLFRHPTHVELVISRLREIAR